MRSAQTDSVSLTDILPTQNKALLDQNQPQVYSLLTGSNSSSSIKSPRRKRTTKLDQGIPVIINPQLTRTAMGVSSAGLHHPSTAISETNTPFVSTHVRDGPSLPFRFYLEHNSYDVNNNMNYDHIPSISIPQNSSLAEQTRQGYQWSKNPLSSISTRSIPQMITKSHRCSLNKLSRTPEDERTTPVPSVQQDYAQLNPSFVFAERRDLIGLTHSLPSSLSSTSTPPISPPKSKRKHSKRLHSQFHLDQPQLSAQQIYQYPTAFPQSTVSNGLPSLIPSSINGTYLQSEEPPCSKDLPTSSNFVPLTPPASIGSIRSPPTNVSNECPSVLSQQYFLTQSTTGTADMNMISKPYSHNQRFTPKSSTITDSYTNGLPFSYQRLSPATHYSQCYMAPSTLISTSSTPITFPSISRRTINCTPSVALGMAVQKVKKDRVKSDEETRAIQSPEEMLVTYERAKTNQSSARELSSTKKRNRRNSHTKKQLRLVARRNRLVVFKFMMQKRKKQKQEKTSLPSISDVTVEQLAPAHVSAEVVKSDQMEAHLPDIVTPSLKISFDAAQKIQSIALFYHRRRKPDTSNESSSKLLNTAENRLSLLIEAVELMETLHGNSKLTLPVIK